MQGQVSPPTFLNDYEIYQLKQRLEVLEDHVFKKKNRPQSTEAQRFLIAHSLGELDKILQSTNRILKQIFTNLNKQNPL
jgi:hypothetical protein